MTAITILVVEDDDALREALCDTLELAGQQVRAAANGRAALNMLADGEIGMVVSDVKMERMNGHTLLKRIKAQRPELPVLLMTAYGTIQQAVEAMRDGAVDYLVKPFEAEVLVNMVDRYLPRTGFDAAGPVVVDARSRALFDQALKVADSDATVMITGDSGTGKEVLARHIHQHSRRRSGPFVAINCAAIPDNMLEATLFGYEKGAFTGAYQACPGKFERAQGGTLLLDEVSEMALGLQAKLLRVLQEREVERIGSHKIIVLDVRVLATSNRTLHEEVTTGRFREDLFYRLNVFPLHMPPLRERAGDILPLAEQLIACHARAMGRPAPALSEEAGERLLKHGWPGNVRELDNLVQRAMILQRGDSLCGSDLQFEVSGTTASTMPYKGNAAPDGLDDDLKAREQQLILEALRVENGHRKACAARLGISERTLRYKLARMRDAGVGIPGLGG